MKIKSENGFAEFVMRTGKDFVKSKAPLSIVEKVIAEGEAEESITFSGLHPGFPLCVGDTFFFPAEEIDKTALEAEPPKPKAKSKKSKAKE